MVQKYLPLYTYGALIILSGIFLIYLESSPFIGMQWALGITLSIASVFAFYTALSRQRKQVQFAYHEMHALAMLVYGISILVFCNTSEKFIFISSFLFIFYAFSEIIFCNWLFNLAQKVKYPIVILRLLFGLAIGIGAVLSMHYSKITLEIFGVLFILIGLNILLYVPIMKETQTINT